jgi:phosphomannomutase
MKKAMNEESEKSPFKAYDVRGVYPKEVNEALAEKIGNSLPKIIKSKKIIIGYDARISSKTLFNALVKGANSAGATALSIGLCTTPKFYFSGRLLNLGGVMITASHNPKNQNGFKFMNKNGALFTKSDMRKIENSHRVEQRKGRLISVDTSKEYGRFLMHCRNFKESGKKLKIVVDAGNGTGGKDFELISKNISVIKLNFRPDGSFPAHNPNPLMKKNIRQLCSAVRKNSADLGIAFDGDADRAVFVDEKGIPIKSDFMAMLFIQELLKKSQKAVLDLRISRIAEKTAVKKHIKIIRSRVGRTNISELMKKTDADFGAELSGHYYFKENNFLDSGVFASAKIIRILSSKKEPLSFIAGRFAQSALSDEKSFRVKDKKKALKHFSRIKGRKDYLDGITISGKNWWINARPSNTENLVRIRGEAEKKKILTALLKKAERFINA